LWYQQVRLLHSLVATGSGLRGDRVGGHEGPEPPPPHRDPPRRARIAPPSECRRLARYDETAPEDLVEALIVVLLIALIVAIFVRPAITVAMVHDYERGLRYRDGRLTGLLSPGTHVAVRPFTELRVLDARPTSITVPGQEILTSDGVALRVSLTARYVVGDPVAAVMNDQNYVSALYSALHAGLRDALAGRTADEVLAARAELGPAVGAAVASELARLGVELLGVDVRDVMVPTELKRAFAGIVAARREGEAALERARGETAALRSLANAGRMVEDNPGLLQLRILQQLGGSSGNTIMLGMPESDGRSRPPTRSTAAVAAAGPGTSGGAGGAIQVAGQGTAAGARADPAADEPLAGGPLRRGGRRTVSD
jgi:regulator of protease activity HflC (stomatin/prohibitin superfamily)